MNKDFFILNGIRKYDYRMSYPKFVQRSEIQFVYPYPEGSKLIFFTPFMAGVKKLMS